MKYFFLFAFLGIYLLPQISKGENYALIAGGSGEDLNKKGNFFAADFKIYEEKLTKRNWRVTTLFDNDTSIIPGSRKATNANIDSAINGVIEKVKPGDQVLLTFHAHGRNSERRSGSHHSIVTEDPDGYSLAKLDEYADRINDKGGKLAVVDLSCYSGHTQNLNGKNSNRGCVVTLASEQYVSICSGAKASNSFTTAFIDLPEPKTPLKLETHFISSREKDSSSSNLPVISSIRLPSKSVWDYFLSNGDPSSVSREGGLRVGNTEAGGKCQICRDDARNEVEVRMLKKFAESVEGGGSALSKDLTDAFAAYRSSSKAIAESVLRIRKKMGAMPNWGFKESALKDLNNITLGNMGMLAKLTDPMINIDEINWLDKKTRERILELRPQHQKIKTAHEKMIGYLGADWKKYEEQKQDLAQKGKTVMALERRIFSLHANSQVRFFNNESALCRDFLL